MNLENWPFHVFSRGLNKSTRQKKIDAYAAMVKWWKFSYLWALDDKCSNAYQVHIFLPIIFSNFTFFILMQMVLERYFSMSGQGTELVVPKSLVLQEKLIEGPPTDPDFKDWGRGSSKEKINWEVVLGQKLGNSWWFSVKKIRLLFNMGIYFCSSGREPLSIQRGRGLLPQKMVTNLGERDTFPMMVEFKVVVVVRWCILTLYLYDIFVGIFLSYIEFT